MLLQCDLKGGNASRREVKVFALEPGGAGANPFRMAAAQRCSVSYWALGFVQFVTPNMVVEATFCGWLDFQNRSKVTAEFGIAYARSKSSVCPHTSSLKPSLTMSSP